MHLSLIKIFTILTFICRHHAYSIKTYSSKNIKISAYDNGILAQLYSKKNNDDSDNRTIIKYDNVGDPIYENDRDNGRGGIDILGIKTGLDPLSASLIVFGLIAFNFFVIANL